MVPIRPVLISPPLIMIVEGHGTWSRCEDRRTGHELFRQRSRNIFRSWGSFRDGDVVGRLDEFGELFVRNFSLIHPEAVDVDSMNRPGVVHGVGSTARAASWIFTPHEKLATRNPNHAFGRLARLRR